jgi:addiction module RelE/StbE family toxin
MAFVIHWSPEAVEDLEAIAEYIARDSHFYAKTVVTKMLAMVESLADFPEMGRIVAELGDKNMRERFVYSYRLIYKIEEQQILIVAIVHGKRLLANVSERF